jgi:hypothetical protein
MRVEHQPLICSSFVGGNAGGDAVELGVRVKCLILYVGCASADVHGAQLDALQHEFI